MILVPLTRYLVHRSHAFIHEFDPYTAAVFYLFFAQLLLLFVVHSLIAVKHIYAIFFSIFLCHLTTISPRYIMLSSKLRPIDDFSYGPFPQAAYSTFSLSRVPSIIILLKSSLICVTVE